jgi:hypothetical protein
VGSSGDRKYIQNPYEAEEALSDYNPKLKVAGVVTHDNEVPGLICIKLYTAAACLPVHVVGLHTG